MKVMRLKSTCSCRVSEAVVEPHSRSTAPLTTEEMRFSGVTLTHLVWRLKSPRSLATLAAIRVQSSTE